MDISSRLNEEDQSFEVSFEQMWCCMEAIAKSVRKEEAGLVGSILCSGHNMYDPNDPEDSHYQVDENYYNTATHVDLVVHDQYDFNNYSLLCKKYDADKSLRVRAFYRIWTNLKHVALDLNRIMSSEYAFEHHYLYFSEDTWMFRNLQHLLPMNRTIFISTEYEPGELCYSVLGTSPTLLSARKFVMDRRETETGVEPYVYEGSRQGYDKFLNLVEKLKNKDKAVMWYKAELEGLTDMDREYETWSYIPGKRLDKAFVIESTHNL